MTAARENDTTESTEAPTAEVVPLNPLAAFPAESRKKIEALVEQGLGEIAKGKKTFSDLLEAIVGDRIPAAPVAPTIPSVPPITDEHRKALAEIANLYGKVVPTEPRLLTDQEVTDLMAERLAIDTITKFLGARKDKSIREAVANHFDRLAENTGLARKEPLVEAAPDGTETVVAGATPTDSNGHYTIKQEVSAPGTGHKFERRTSHSKPKVTSAVIQKALDAGVITRKEYIAVTVKPEVPRELSEEALRKAIKKDPGLLFRLAQFAEPGTTTTAIYAPEDK